MKGTIRHFFSWAILAKDQFTAAKSSFLGLWSRAEHYIAPYSRPTIAKLTVLIIFVAYLKKKEKLPKRDYFIFKRHEGFGKDHEVLIAELAWQYPPQPWVLARHQNGKDARVLWEEHIFGDPYFTVLVAVNNVQTFAIKIYDHRSLQKISKVLLIRISITPSICM